MTDHPAPVAERERLQLLDVLRGLAVLGILVVNAPVFAMPPEIGDTPTLSPAPFEGVSVILWWVKQVFFEQKFVTLFSLLFGVSVYLVGGERGSSPKRGAVLRRRLLWLAAFGAVHGALIWYGDILLLYALAGLLMMLCRSWRPTRLAAVGLPLIALGAYRILEQAFTVQGAARVAPTLQDGEAKAIPELIARFGGAFGDVQATNFDLWWLATDWTIEFYGPMTLGLMMVGLSLFKAGVLTGRAPAATYWLLIGLGAAALTIIGWNAADQARDGFPPQTRAFDLLPNLTLAPLVTLGYVATISLALRAGRLRRTAAALASVGRMAFTNYIAQSLIMTAIFYGGGRGLGLYGRLDWPQWTLIVSAVWMLQIGWSTLWLSRFAMGPLEWGWRRLSYGRPVPLRRNAAPERPSVPTA